MPKLHFAKFHALGNDFVIVNATDKSAQYFIDKAKLLGNRYMGIGFDQLLLIEKSNIANFKYRIFNQDGSEVGQCGNGARCFMAYLHLYNLTDKISVKVETKTRTMSLYLTSKIDKNNLITEVNIGQANFNATTIPFLADSVTQIANNVYLLDLQKQSIKFGVVYIGNPHMVILNTLAHDFNGFNLQAINSIINSSKLFPEGVNINLPLIENKNQIKLRVFERGVGETLACGSGAVATVAYLNKQGLCAHEVDIQLANGTVKVAKKDKNYYLSGLATRIYDGYIHV